MAEIGSAQTNTNEQANAPKDTEQQAAQQTIAEFQTAPATQEALQLMVQSYDALGLTDLRDDARRVLERNFPGNQLRAETGPKPWWKVW